MPVLTPGLVHTPVTPFTRKGDIAFDLYGRLLDFHLANGAQALALPLHVGESVSLTQRERLALLEFALAHMQGRIPVLAHVSESGTASAAAIARHAEKTGAAAIIATTPYYWTPPPTMLIEHFAAIGTATKLPFFVYHAPDEMAGVRVSAELCRELIAKLPNFAGVIDLGLDWQFMIELMTDAPRLRPGFQLISGTELMVSPAAIGATAMFAPLAAIAPGMVRDLYALCSAGKLFAARTAQEQLAQLRQAIKPGGVAALKAAMRVMGRDCGVPRAPVLALEAVSVQRLVSDLDAIELLRSEPRSW